MKCFLSYHGQVADFAVLGGAASRGLFPLNPLPSPLSYGRREVYTVSY